MGMLRKFLQVTSLLYKLLENAQKKLFNILLVEEENRYTLDNQNGHFKCFLRKDYTFHASRFKKVRCSRISVVEYSHKT